MYRNISPLYVKALLVILVIGTVCYLITINWKDDTYPLRQCYEYDAKRALNITEPHWFLEDILKATRQPQPGRTIFFHVTNCLNLYIQITDRQACAIESAARLNPDWDIFVLFASPVAFSLDMTKAMRELVMYSNIYWRNVDLWAYAQDTPAQEWIFDRNQLLRSKYLVVHLSDYIRLVSLYRYGGTHMDLDFVMIKSISNLEPNYACAASNISVNNAVLNFDHIGFGHEIVKDCLQDFVQHFDGVDWASNGPGVITRALQRACNTKNTTEMKRAHCDFEILPHQTFYALNWTDWRILFDAKRTSEVELMTKESFAVHFWNSKSDGTKLRIGSDHPTAYEKFAKESCPRVYDSLDTFF